MKRRVISVLACAFCLANLVSVSAGALDKKEKIVDGSYLTYEETSKGTTAMQNTRGLHLMDGECSITKAGLKRVYCYGATTANHEVDYVAVIVYVDQYYEEEDEWGQIAWWMEEQENDYFVNTGKSVVVDKGHFYRVHADHFVRKDPDPMEETFSATNGIWVPQ